jgi:hypothetical protein
MMSAFPLAKQASFQLPDGHRRLAHRDSDIMWLNMALQDDPSRRVNLSVRRPVAMDAAVWEGWQQDTKLAYLDAQDLCEVPGVFFVVFHTTTKNPVTFV